MEISLSPSLGVFIFQLVSFFFLLAIIKKFFLPIILDVLAKRENFINEQINNAKLIEDEKESLSKFKQQVNDEITKKREDSLNDIEKLRNEMILKTDMDISSLREKKILQLEKEIVSLRDEFLQQKKNEICKVSLLMVEQIVKKEMSDERIKKQFLNDFLDRIDTIEVGDKCQCR